jgi:hypothetical protein
MKGPGDKHKIDGKQRPIAPFHIGNQQQTSSGNPLDRETVSNWLVGFDSFPLGKSNYDKNNGIGTPNVIGEASGLVPATRAGATVL